MGHRRNTYISIADRKCAEHKENYFKELFGAACRQATAKGLTWSYENEMIWVKGPDGSEVGCNGRVDFAQYVREYTA